jgi:serine O-acetyltransferase
MAAPRIGKKSSPEGGIAERLVASYAADAPLSIAAGHELPSPPEVQAVLTDLRELLFPGFTGERRATGATLKTQVEARLAQVRVRLSEQVFRGVHHRCRASGADCRACEEAAARITDGLLESLPDLRALLMTDVRAAFEGDPAATGADEVVFSYPGIQSICVYRLAHRLHELGAAIVPRMMTELAHSETGIDIHPAAVIGEAFFIDHGTGVVIGETAEIGDNVMLYHQVTLGATGWWKHHGDRRVKRHPTIEDNVTIGVGASILGPITIGHDSKIGAMALVVESLPPHSMVVAQPAKLLTSHGGSRTLEDLGDEVGLDFVI